MTVYTGALHIYSRIRIVGTLTMLFELPAACADRARMSGGMSLEGFKKMLPEVYRPCPQWPQRDAAQRRAASRAGVKRRRL